MVGLPLNMDGTEGAQAAVDAGVLRAAAGRRWTVPVETYDERLTTRMAQASRRAGAGAAEDSLAAAHLLEAYLAAVAGVPGRGRRWRLRTGSRTIPSSIPTTPRRSSGPGAAASAREAPARRREPPASRAPPTPEPEPPAPQPGPSARAVPAGTRARARHPSEQPARPGRGAGPAPPETAPAPAAAPHPRAVPPRRRGGRGGFGSRRRPAAARGAVLGPGGLREEPAPPGPAAAPAGCAAASA